MSKDDEDEDFLYCEDDDCSHVLDDSDSRSESFFTSSIVDFDVNKKKNIFSTNINNCLNKFYDKIIEFSKVHNIDIKIFKMFIKKKYDNQYEKTAFEAASHILLEVISQQVLPKYNYLSYQSSVDVYTDVPEYFSSSDAFDKNFAYWSDQAAYRYAEVIYVIFPCKITPLSKTARFKRFSITNEYIGRTSETIFKRFERAVSNVIRYYLNNERIPSRPLLKLIFWSLEELISHPGYSYNYENFDDFIINYKIKRFFEKVLLKKTISEELLNYYFDIKILEVHRTFKYGPEREKKFKEEFTYEGRVDDDGGELIGTIMDVGLNSNAKLEGLQTHKQIPLYDLVFLISMGYTPDTITYLLQKKYDNEIKKDNVLHQIRRFWNSLTEARMNFLKPVILSLIQSDPKIRAKNITDTFEYSSRDKAFTTKGGFFDQAFGGISFTQLRNHIHLNSLTEIGTDSIDDIIYGIKQKSDLIRGIPKSKWKKWFYQNIGPNEIAKLVGYKNGESFRKSFFGLDRVNGKPRLGTIVFGIRSYEEAVSKYQRLRTIEILIEEPNTPLESIYSEELGYYRRDEYANSGNFYKQIKDFFERIFKDDRTSESKRITLEILKSLSSRDLSSMMQKK